MTDSAVIPTGGFRLHDNAPETPFDAIDRQEASTQASAFVRKGGKPFGIVPFALLECRSLSPLARLVALWIESKPADWVVRPAVLQKALGISEKQWLSARRAMIGAGIFTHRKWRRPDGTWAWNSEFDVTSLSASIPLLTAHGEAADIEVRDEERRNSSTQRTVGACTVVQTPPEPTARGKQSGLSELKRLHIGFVLNELEIEWWQEGDYVYWNDYCRARKADDGHWLWAEADGKGDVRSGGSAIDLIMSENGCSQAQAINQLRRIYQEAIRQKA